MIFWTRNSNCYTMLVLNITGDLLSTDRVGSKTQVIDLVPSVSLFVYFSVCTLLFVDKGRRSFQTDGQTDKRMLPLSPCFIKLCGWWLPRGRGNISGSIRLSVCLFAFYGLNCWTYELKFGARIEDHHILNGFEVKIIGQRSRSPRSKMSKFPFSV